MRIGSKVYCIKDHNYGYIKGNYYIIDDIINSDIIAVESSHTVDSFAFTTNKDSILTEYFYEYFITEKEYRKIKLEKLNESR